MVSLNFSQREGEEEAPKPLSLKELSDPLRNDLWNLVHNEQNYGRPIWEPLLRKVHCSLFNEPIDIFVYSKVLEFCKKIIYSNKYNRVFDLFEFFFSNLADEFNIHEKVEDILSSRQAAYKIINSGERQVFYPKGLELENEAVAEAFGTLAENNLDSPLKHLEGAVIHFRNGKNSDSIRESIHAVESLVKIAVQ